MSKKLLMIVNPAAGKSKGRVYEQRVSALYTQAGWDCDIRNTQGAGDAARFALQEGAQADDNAAAHWPPSGNHDVPVEGPVNTLRVILAPARAWHTR